MKKIFIPLILIISILLSCVVFVSCNSKDTPTEDVTDPPTEKSSEQPTEEPSTEGLELNIIDDNYRNWYQIYVYSFYDSDGDGVGDINGVTKKLDYIKDMGFNGICFMPVNQADAYHKNDINDHFSISDELGSLEDFDNLVSKAHENGIRVIVELPLNYTSTEHSWFEQACEYIIQNGQIGGEYGEYYKFTDIPDENYGYTQIDGTTFFCESSNAYGLPELDLSCDGVREQIKNIIEFWLSERDIDGFRLSGTDTYYASDSQNIEFLTWLVSEAKGIDADCFIVGEVLSFDSIQVNKYYQSGIDSIQLFSLADGTGALAQYLRQHNGKMLGNLFVELQKTYGDNMFSTYISSNKTSNRVASYVQGTEGIKIMNGLLALMNGSIFMYYGDEIGMISRDGIILEQAKMIAMHWSDSFDAEGYCSIAPEGVTVDGSSYMYASADKQLQNEDSILNYCKKALRLRNCLPEIARGDVTFFEQSSDGICVIRKQYGDDISTIVINLGLDAKLVSVEQEILGYTQGMIEQLCVYGTDEASFDPESETLEIPAYSIVIFK